MNLERIITDTIVSMTNEVVSKEKATAISEEILKLTVANNKKCYHPYHAVKKDKITELCSCSDCGDTWY